MTPRPITAKIKARARTARRNGTRLVQLTQKEFDQLKAETVCSTCLSLTIARMNFAGCKLEITE